jgi:hypothetical protein
MANRPAFQFYPADWRNNSKLRRCSEAARGAWIDVLCLMHDSDEYGVLRWPLSDIARATGLPIKLLKELVAKEVLKGGDKGCDGYVFTPRHAGKDGEPVELIKASKESCWYSTRFVRDEYVRQRRGVGTRFDSENNPQNKQPKDTPKVRVGDGKGDGLSSSSSSSINNNNSVITTRAIPVCEFEPSLDVYRILQDEYFIQPFFASAELEEFKHWWSDKGERNDWDSRFIQRVRDQYERKNQRAKA